MSENYVVSIFQDAVYTIIIVSAPMLLSGLLVGLIVSIFQATTQIQEQTLAFIPKIVAVLVALVVFGPWMISHLVQFANNMFEKITLIS